MKKMVLLPYDRYQRLLSAKAIDESKSTIKEEGEEIVRPKEALSATDGVDRTETSAEYPSINIERLLTSFSKALQGRARSILIYIQPYINWNQKGEVIISGEKIPNSNIVDLVKVLLKDYKHFRPVGLQQFEALLSDINFPHTLLSASRRLQSGGSNIPPPPGIPVKRKPKEREDNLSPSEKIKWRRL
jgi:hypothetical protein